MEIGNSPRDKKRDQIHEGIYQTPFQKFLDRIPKNETDSALHPKSVPRRPRNHGFPPLGYIMNLCSNSVHCRLHRASHGRHNPGYHRAVWVFTHNGFVTFLSFRHKFSVVMHPLEPLEVVEHEVVERFVLHL